VLIVGTSGKLTQAAGIQWSSAITLDSLPGEECRTATVGQCKVGTCIRGTSASTLDTCDDDPSAPKRLESKHRLGEPFDGPVVLHRRCFSRGPLAFSARSDGSQSESAPISGRRRGNSRWKAPAPMYIDSSPCWRQWRLTPIPEQVLADAGCRRAEEMANRSKRLPSTQLAFAPGPEGRL